MKYITILELGNEECANAGTITVENVEAKFKEAIESHFDAEMLRYKFVDTENVNSLIDCIDAVPIEVIVYLDILGDETEYIVELSQTYLY
jgi:hypothetical protein